MITLNFSHAPIGYMWLQLPCAYWTSTACRLQHIKKNSR